MKKKIKITFLLLLNLIGFNMVAQTSGNESTTESSFPFVLLIALVGIGVVLIAVSYMLYALTVFVASARKEGVMENTSDVLKLTDAVPLDREHEILLDHSYDGIRELDNRLPPWWLYMFYGTVIFSVFYMWYYHVYGTGNVQEEEYLSEMKQAEIEMKIAASKMDENSVTLLSDANRIKSGEILYQNNCSPCHGKKGEGGVGPNLTDEYWIHGGDIKDVFKTVKYGVPAKGMIPWQDQLGPSQMQEVSSYILTLKGSNPPNAKEPQGELTK